MKKLIRIIQKFLLTISLFLLYYGAMGAAALCSRSYRRLTISRKSRMATFWRPGEGYEPDIGSCTRQS